MITNEIIPVNYVISEDGTSAIVKFSDGSITKEQITVLGKRIEIVFPFLFKEELFPPSVIDTCSGITWTWCWRRVEKDTTTLCLLHEI